MLGSLIFLEYSHLQHNQLESVLSVASGSNIDVIWHLNLISLFDFEFFAIIGKSCFMLLFFE